MKVLRPVAITDSMLISSTVPEPDGAETAWDSGTTYGEGDEVYLASTHRLYRSKQAANTNKAPATESDWWLDIGGTNRWAMFDDYVSTLSSDTTTLEVTVAPGLVDALFLYGMVGETAEVVMRDGLGGPVVYTRSLTLQAPNMSDWYAYYFEPNRQIPIFALTDLPPYLNAHITVTIEGTGTVSCGLCQPGRTYYIGQTFAGARAGIRDYSRKTTDADTGFTVLEQRKYAKTLDATVRIERQRMSDVHQQLEDLRATACAWIADDTAQITPLSVYGFYRDMYLTVQYATFGVYTLQIEGMV